MYRTKVICITSYLLLIFIWQITIVSATTTDNKCKDLKIPKCGPNSHYTETAEPCPATCNYTTPLPCKAQRRPGCECNDGYVLNKKKCVKLEQCAKLAKCSANEIWVHCAVKCPDLNCPKDDQPQPVCDAPYPCPSGCICKVNHKIDLVTGKCILASECPPVPCTRPNEEWNSCPSPCLTESCTDARNPPVTCNTLILNCQPRCVCKEGHYRNDDGICVPLAECPEPKCPTNQTWAYCAASCPDQYCQENDEPLPVCDPPYPCPSGCVCDRNYRMNKNGDCISVFDCPPVNCTHQNEDWDPCPSACLAENCDDVGKEPVVCNTLLLNCQPKCVCRKGHFRNPDGICVPADKCRAA